MEDLLKSFWGVAATVVEGAAALLIAIGAAEAFAMSLMRFRAPTAQKMQIWMHFATWLLLGLEFELAADVIRTAIAPTWSDIGQLASIAAIRTFLSYFLDRTLKRFPIQEKAPIKISFKTAALSVQPRHPLHESPTSDRKANYFHPSTPESKWHNLKHRRPVNSWGPIAHGWRTNGL